LGLSNYSGSILLPEIGIESIQEACMTSSHTAPAASFQTPPRILIPKLVRSRDAWKAKATQRKHQGKALQVRVRDLSASRLRHRQRADRLAQQLDQLRLQLEHTQQQLDQTRQPQREALRPRRAAESSSALPPPAVAPAPLAVAAAPQKKTS
jgi:hypothetical protein